MKKRAAAIRQGRPGARAKHQRDPEKRKARPAQHAENRRYSHRGLVSENHDGEEPSSSSSDQTTTMINQTAPLLLSLLLLGSYLRPCSAIPRPVAGTSWQLHSIALPTDTIDSDGNEVTQLTPVLSNTEITAHFGDDGSQVAGTVTGSGGCNDYFTGFQVDLSTMGIKFNQVGATEMDCGEEIMGQEFAYFAALAKTNGHEIFGDKLKLRGESGTMLLLFIPLLDDSAHMDGDVSTEADILVGTEWRATSYATEDAPSDLTPILSGSDVTLEFESGANFNGRGGCNSYFGSYASSADGRLSIFELGSTEMGCIDPPGRMGQEMAYFKALQNAAEYRLREIDGGGIQILLLLDDNGNIVLTFVPAETDFDTNEDFNTLVAANTSEIGLNGGILDGEVQVSIPETVMMEDQDFEIYDAARDASSARADAMMSLAQRGFFAVIFMVECINLLL